MDACEITVIGGGAVGLSVAACLAAAGRDVLLVERHPGPGRETSSRSSEVIHCGLYYRPRSLKARLCVEGNRLLYAACAAHGVPHRATGKLIVALDALQEAGLERLLANGQANGVEGLRLIDGAELRRMEPRVAGRAALLCPTTGIVDSHGLIRLMERQASDGGALLVYGTEVQGLECAGGEWTVATRTGTETHRHLSRFVVNCAGLEALRLAALAGVATSAAGYEAHWVKGEYFRVSAAKASWVERLVYPFPPGPGNVGVHTVTDLRGQLKLGPYNCPADRLDYEVDAGHRDAVLEAVRAFLPFLTADDLAPDQCGIQPKAQAPGAEERDFTVAHEAGRGLPGLINLIGIESPGLTASPALGRLVAGLVGDVGC